MPSAAVKNLRRPSGLNVANRVRILGFMQWPASSYARWARLLAVGRIGIAETVTGKDFMFISITAVVVGGTALWGGIGGVWNTLVGVLIVNVINNGMVVIGLPELLSNMPFSAFSSSSRWFCRPTASPSAS